MIIALNTEELMREFGVKTVRTVTRVDEALAAITERAPDFAVLDVNLGSETSFAIAGRLSDAGIPFAFATGYGESIAVPTRFAEAPKIHKPYSPDALRAALAHARSRQ